VEHDIHVEQCLDDSTVQPRPVVTNPFDDDYDDGEKSPVDGRSTPNSGSHSSQTKSVCGGGDAASSYQTTASQIEYVHLDTNAQPKNQSNDAEYDLPDEHSCILGNNPNVEHDIHVEQCLDDSTVQPRPVVTNPFDDDYDDGEKSPVDERSTINAGRGGNIHTPQLVLNPFDDGYDESSLPHSVPSSKTSNTSTNPFDDGYVSTCTTKLSPAAVKRSETCSVITSSRQWAFSRCKSASAVSVTPAVHAPSPPVGSCQYNEMVKLLELGFTPRSAYKAITKHHNFDKALAELQLEIRQDVITNNAKKHSLWVPLLYPRVGSWMPSAANTCNAIHYYITLKIPGTNEDYVVMKRYSDFVSLKSELAPYLRKIKRVNFDIAPFVDDRLSTLVLGSTEKTFNERREMLHRWLQSICLNSSLCTIPKAAKHLMDFLCFDANVRKVVSHTGNVAAPLELKLQVCD